MREIPIPFSAPMIRAILAGQKTQTRRVLKATIPDSPSMDATHPKHKAIHPAPYLDAYCGQIKTASNPRGMSGDWCWWTRDDRCGLTFKVGFIPGDRLWVREEYYQFGHWEPTAGKLTKGGKQKWQFVSDGEDIRFEMASGYRLARRQSDPGTPAWHKRPGRFMPRKYSRTTLEVTDVRVERLQDISEADAVAEGIEQIATTGCDNAVWKVYGAPDCWPGYLSPVLSYKTLWNNGPGSWEANPWVVAISFRRIESAETADE